MVLLDDFKGASELAQRLILRRCAEAIAAALPDSPIATYLDSLCHLAALLAAYRQQQAEPKLVQIHHLERLCLQLLNAEDTAGESRQAAFRPLLVALSRASAEPMAVVEGDTGIPQPFPLELVLVNLRSAFNVGSIVRSAECYGSRHVHVAGYTAGLDHPKVASVAMGCEQLMPWSQNPDPAGLLASLKRRGLALIALETCEQAVPIGEFNFPFPAVLLVGNERFGLEPDLLALCHHHVRLPMYGRKNSLNVANATAVFLHNARSQWELRL